MLVLLLLIFLENSYSREVFVQKCCEDYEIMVDNKCTFTNETNQESWTPVFQGVRQVLVCFSLLIVCLVVVYKKPFFSNFLSSGEFGIKVHKCTSDFYRQVIIL